MRFLERNSKFNVHLFSSSVEKDEARIGFGANGHLFSRHIQSFCYLKMKIANRKVFKGNNTNNNTMETQTQEEQELVDVNLQHLLRGKQKQKELMQEIAEW